MEREKLVLKFEFGAGIHEEDRMSRAEDIKRIIRGGGWEIRKCYHMKVNRINCMIMEIMFGHTDGGDARELCVVYMDEKLQKEGYEIAHAEWARCNMDGELVMKLNIMDRERIELVKESTKKIREIEEVIEKANAEEEVEMENEQGKKMKASVVKLKREAHILNRCIAHWMSYAPDVQDRENYKFLDGLMHVFVEYVETYMNNASVSKILVMQAEWEIAMETITEYDDGPDTVEMIMESIAHIMHGTLSVIEEMYEE